MFGPQRDSNDNTEKLMSAMEFGGINNPRRFISLINNKQGEYMNRMQNGDNNNQVIRSYKVHIQNALYQCRQIN